MQDTVSDLTSMKLSKQERDRRLHARQSKHSMTGVHLSDSSDITLPDVAVDALRQFRLSARACSDAGDSVVAGVARSSQAGQHAPDDSARQTANQDVSDDGIPAGLDYSAIASSLRSAHSRMAATAPPRRREAAVESSPSVGYQSDGVVDFEAEVRSFHNRGASASAGRHGSLQGPYDDQLGSENERSGCGAAEQSPLPSRRSLAHELRAATREPSAQSTSSAGRLRPDAHIRSHAAQAASVSKQAHMRGPPAASSNSHRGASSSSSVAHPGGALEGSGRTQALSKLSASRGKRSAAPSTTTGAQPATCNNESLACRVRTLAAGTVLVPSAALPKSYARPGAVGCNRT